MKILVALDAAKPRESEVVLEPAANLARAANADVILINVFNPWVDMGHIVASNMEAAAEQVTTERRRYLEGHLDKLSGIRVQTLVERQQRGEEVAECITRVAREYQADLIAVASKRVVGAMGVLLGSVGHSLLSLSPCPILVVRPK